jgi:hypothetical protein
MEAKSVFGLLVELVVGLVVEMKAKSVVGLLVVLVADQIVAVGIVADIDVLIFGLVETGIDKFVAVDSLELVADNAALPVGFAAQIVAYCYSTLLLLVSEETVDCLGIPNVKCNANLFLWVPSNLNNT